MPTKDIRWAPVCSTDVGEVAASVTRHGHKNKEYDLTVNKKRLKKLIF